MQLERRGALEMQYAALRCNKAHEDAHGRNTMQQERRSLGVLETQEAARTRNKMQEAAIRCKKPQ